METKKLTVSMVLDGQSFFRAEETGDDAVWEKTKLGSIECEDGKSLQYNAVTTREIDIDGKFTEVQFYKLLNDQEVVEVLQTGDSYVGWTA